MMQKARDEKASDTSGTVARTLAVLTVMAESGGSVGVTDVATALGLPMSTSHRLLDLLRGAGFVERDAAQRRYRLGLQFLRVANLVTQNTSFARLCQPTLDRIDRRWEPLTIWRASAGRARRDAPSNSSACTDSKRYGMRVRSSSSESSPRANRALAPRCGLRGRLT